MGKAVCVGRNYATHAKEFGNAVPEAPILFLKPSTTIVPLMPTFAIPNGRGACHHENEIAVWPVFVLIAKVIWLLGASKNPPFNPCHLNLRSHPCQ